MATTSLSLGEHWETFLREQVSTGRYGSASEVVRDALRGMEDRLTRLEGLRAHLRQGEEQATAGHFVAPFSIAALIDELDAEE